MKIWLLLFLLSCLLLTTWTVAHEKIYQNEFSPKIDLSSRDGGSLDISKITGWTNSENVASFTVTLLASQLIVASGWLIFGKILRSKYNSYRPNSPCMVSIMVEAEPMGGTAPIYSPFLTSENFAKNWACNLPRNLSSCMNSSSSIASSPL